MRIGFIIVLILVFNCIHAQFNSRFIIGTDLYQWYRNPIKNSSDLPGSSGGTLSAIIGSEIMAGRNNYSVGLETHINLGWLNLDTDYKGWGAVAFPILLKLNAGSLSGFSTKLIGWSMGAGIQFQKTELLGLTKKYDSYTREFFPTYIGQIEVGGGIGGLNLSYYLRIGTNPDLPDAYNFNTGILLRLNYFHKNVSQEKGHNPLKS